MMSKQTYEVSLERYEFIVMQLKHNPIHVACFRGQMFHVTSALLIKARLTCVLRILRSADDLLSPSSCSMLCSIAAGKQTEQVQHRSKAGNAQTRLRETTRVNEDRTPRSEFSRFTEKTAKQLQSKVTIMNYNRRLKTSDKFNINYNTKLLKPPKLKVTANR